MCGVEVTEERNGEDAAECLGDCGVCASGGFPLENSGEKSD